MILEASRAVAGFPSTIAEILDRFHREDEGATFNFLIDTLCSEDLTSHYFATLGDVEHLITAEPIFQTQDQMTRGAVLFFAFHRIAVDAQATKPRADMLSLITDNPDFIHFLCRFHGIPADLGIKRLVFHASGTTSFILKAKTKQYHICALKIIQANYVRIPSIRTATMQFEATFGLETKYSPDIYDSSETWILMQFIDGPNLHDYLLELRQTESIEFLSETYVNSLATIFNMIAEAMSYYELMTPPIVHGDLTPFNIIVELKGSVPVGVKLIDFGPNYLLKERLGNRGVLAEALSQTELFIAPEVLWGLAGPSIRSDLYSLGMIGLELLSAEALVKDRVGSQLREIWQHPATVGIAEIVEDLIDDQVDHRALILQKSADQGYYTSLNVALQDQVRLYKDIVEKGTAKKHPLSLPRGSDLLASIIQIFLILRTKEGSYKSVTSSLLVSTIVNFVCHSLVTMAFVIYSLVDVMEYLHFKIPFLQTFNDVVNFIPHSFQVGDLWGNLPGRCVALTFSLVASRYYANIFSSLRIVNMNHWLQPVANVCLRLNSFSYFVPIMVAIVYKPQWWPYCAAIGILFPALNNLICWQIAKIAISRSASRFTMEKVHRAQTEWFMRYFWEWWLLMFAYSLAIFVIGVMLSRGWAADEAIYGYCVCIINVLKIYRSNCRRDAPVVLGHFARCYFNIRRAALIG